LVLNGNENDMFLRVFKIPTEVFDTSKFTQRNDRPGMYTVSISRDGDVYSVYEQKVNDYMVGKIDVSEFYSKDVSPDLG
jgi:hypothetical protein